MMKVFFEKPCCACATALKDCNPKQKSILTGAGILSIVEGVLIAISSIGLLFFIAKMVGYIFYNKDIINSACASLFIIALVPIGFILLHFFIFSSVLLLILKIRITKKISCLAADRLYKLHLIYELYFLFVVLFLVVHSYLAKNGILPYYLGKS